MKTIVPDSGELDPKVFDRMPWSAWMVSGLVCDRIRSCGYNVSAVPVGNDVKVSVAPADGVWVITAVIVGAAVNQAFAIARLGSDEMDKRAMPILVIQALKVIEEDVDKATQKLRREAGPKSVGKSN